MSWTELEYRLIKFYGLHRYDAFANPDKVGLGQCRCGEDMYWCDHSTHWARALIAEFELDKQNEKLARAWYDGMAAGEAHEEAMTYYRMAGGDVPQRAACPYRLTEDARGTTD